MKPPTKIQTVQTKAISNIQTKVETIQEKMKEIAKSLPRKVAVRPKSAAARKRPVLLPHQKPEKKPIENTEDYIVNTGIHDFKLVTAENLRKKKGIGNSPPRPTSHFPTISDADEAIAEETSSNLDVLTQRKQLKEFVCLQPHFRKKDSEPTTA